MHENFFCALIVFFASAVEAGFGFGAGLIAIPLLSLMLGLRDSVAVCLVFQFFKCVLLFWGWRHVALNRVIIIGIFIPAGVFLGYTLLSTVRPEWLEIALSVYLFLFVFNQIFHRNDLSFGQLPQSAVQAVAGVAGGFFLGLTGTGGPIIVTRLQSMNLNKDSLRFSLIFLFAIANASRLLLGLNEKFFNTKVLSTIIFCVPAYIFALLVGYQLPKLVHEKQFRTIINTLLFLSACSLLIKACHETYPTSPR